MGHKALFDLLEVTKTEYRKNEPMCEHTSFKIGGKADIFIMPASTDVLGKIIALLNNEKIPYFILGKGSNLLVSDKGIEGAVISLSRLDAIEVSGDEITAGAGASLMAVCIAARNAGLSGLEFAYGIPASVGGAMFMNAGAYGGEMADVVKSAEYVDIEGNTETIPKEDMDLGYRKSIFKKGGKIVTSVTFKLTKGDQKEIRSSMDDFMGRRRSKQPLEYPSAGSTFKRPEGYFAGALIEKNNLKGVTVGGAQVSEKHAGFVINCGNATCEDVKMLMKKVQETVLKNDGVMLEPEVIFVGRN